MIERAGWDTHTGLAVDDLPKPVASERDRQTLRVALPWPAPAPHAPVYIWLRGESEGRITHAKTLSGGRARNIPRRPLRLQSERSMPASSQPAAPAPLIPDPGTRTPSRSCPDRRPPSRWRWLALVAGVGVVAGGLWLLLRQNPVDKGGTGGRLAGATNRRGRYRRAHVARLGTDLGATFCHHHGPGVCGTGLGQGPGPDEMPPKPARWSIRATSWPSSIRNRCATT